MAKRNRGPLEALRLNRCSHCGHSLRARVSSYFTGQFICMPCSFREAEHIAQLIAAGLDPEDYYECGCVPRTETLADAPPRPVRTAAMAAQIRARLIPAGCGGAGAKEQHR